MHMRNFMIGQYGQFDHKKYKRDFKKGFYGIEACLLAAEEDVQTLQREAQVKGFQIGVHFPLRAGKSPFRDALFMHPDDGLRSEAFALVERELQYMQVLKPVYVLFHYPKPVILDDRVDWQEWRFADASEYVFESEYSISAFVERSERLFAWLSEKGEAYQFVPVLEFDALNRYVYETDVVEKLLMKYPKIKLCLDSGRLFLQDKIDPHFDSRRVVKMYAKYAWSLHLWTMKATDVFSHNHYPVLPACKPEFGWAPIEDYLRIVREINSDVKIMFEHRSELIDDKQLMTCYTWVEQLLYGERERADS
ncbi:sugar phosphate isomerase/epimerase [Brevibacillus agri]|uniref:sugar phosphate isomerase/epimerase n=1 Tax=Brevibacillus agri TaxID=51101 RepID=UPI002E22C7BD